MNTDFVDQLETNKTGKIVMKEKARLLQLCVTLEARLGDVSQELKMTDEVSIPVWIKAIIADRELKKRLRQEDKGKETCTVHSQTTMSRRGSQERRWSQEEPSSSLRLSLLLRDRGQASEDWPRSSS